MKCYFDFVHSYWLEHNGQPAIFTFNNIYNRTLRFGKVTYCGLRLPSKPHRTPEYCSSLFSHKAAPVFYFLYACPLCRRCRSAKRRPCRTSVHHTSRSFHSRRRLEQDVHVDPLQIHFGQLSSRLRYNAKLRVRCSCDAVPRSA